MEKRYFVEENCLKFIFVGEISSNYLTALDENNNFQFL